MDKNKLFPIDLPLLLAPMAGAADSKMAISVAKAGGLGSIACAMLDEEKIRSEVFKFRKECPEKPLNLNFFCHQKVEMTEAQEKTWEEALTPYFREFNIEQNKNASFPERRPFDEKACLLLEELRPGIVSFHFGLPDSKFIKRLKACDQKIISTATTVNEAIWLEEHGGDAIIAQGFEAGGHRGMFLTEDISTQMGTIALVPLIVDRVKVPVIVAGGISDHRGVKAAFILGASYVQIGSAYLLTHESLISPIHREKLLANKSSETVITNLFSGKPARSVINRMIKELGPLSSKVPPFPYAGKALASLKEVGNGSFISLWSGQALSLQKEIISAEELTRRMFE